MQEANLSITNSFPFNQLSTSSPDVNIFRWCNSAVDYLEFEGSAQRLEELEGKLKVFAKDLGSHLIYLGRSDRSLSAMLACKCSAHNSTIRLIETCNCLWKAPVTYNHGRENLTLISIDHKILKDTIRVLQETGRVEIKKLTNIEPSSLRDIYTISLSTLLGGMTDKQLAHLSRAITSGYYRIPKEVTIEKLAASSGLSPSSTQEHISKAESTLMEALKPYINLYIIWRDSQKIQL